MYVLFRFSADVTGSQVPSLYGALPRPPWGPTSPVVTSTFALPPWLECLASHAALLLSFPLPLYWLSYFPHDFNVKNFSFHGDVLRGFVPFKSFCIFL